MENQVREFVTPAFGSLRLVRLPHAVRYWRAVLIPLVVLDFLSGAGVASARIGTWTSNGPEGGFFNALEIDPMTPTTLYAGTEYSGVFKSTNGGGTWSVTGLTATGVRALAIDPLTPTTLYVGTVCCGVFKSTNGGGTWSTTGLIAFNVQPLPIDPLTPTILYAATSGGGVFALQQAP